MTWGRIGFLLWILVALCCPAFAWGDEFRFVPSMSVKEDYNSNVLFTTNNTGRDFITTLSPGVEIWDSTGRLDTDLLFRLGRLEYAKNSDLDATNQTYDGKFRYALTPLLNVSAEGGYTKINNPTLNILTTGIVMAAVPWNHISASMSADYQLSEKTALGLTYNYGNDYYGDPRFNSDTSHDVGGGITYDFSEYVSTLKGRMNVDYSRISFPDSHTDSVVATVGFSRDFNEVWNISLNGGIRHSSTESTVQVVTQVPTGLFTIINGQIEEFVFLEARNENVRSADTGLVGNASLNYKGDRTTGSLTFSRGVTPAYTFSGAAVQNALTVSVRYQLTYELSAILSSSYNTLKTIPSSISSQLVNQHTCWINPVIRYEFSKGPLKIFDREKDVAVEASYEYTSVDYTLTKTEADRHIFSIRLTMQHPFLE